MGRVKGRGKREREEEAVKDYKLHSRNYKSCLHLATPFYRWNKANKAHGCKFKVKERNGRRREGGWLNGGVEGGGRRYIIVWEKRKESGRM